MRIVERRLQETIWFDTRRDVELVHFIVRCVPTSQYVRKLISTFMLEKKINANQKNLQVPFLSPNFCWLLIFAITQTENAKQAMCIRDQKCGCDMMSNWNHNKKWTCACPSYTESTSQSLRWYWSRRKQFQKELNTVSTNAEKLPHWLAGTFLEMLQDITSLCVQQYEIRCQTYYELLTTFSRKWARYWSDCYHKRTSQILSSIFVNIQLLDNLNILGNAANLDSPLKVY